jgi:hypothetical protein
MRVSKAFGLTKTQAELDFVDVELTEDTPLFVDPFALSIRKDEWSYRCTQHVVSFFQAAINAIHSGNHDRARQILTNLSEPNETRLGLSTGMPNGRGVSGKQAFDLYEALVESEAAKTGILSEMAECDLFVYGIGPDKISDITTNVIRGPLIEYTKHQCELHGIPLTPNVPAGNVWEIGLEDWIGVYADLPIWDSKPILLVPKATVRFRLCLDSQEYYNHFILNFLQAEHLKAGSSLVRTFKRSGRQYVAKKDLKQLHPFSKDELYRFTKAHPEVLKLYKELERKELATSNRLLDQDFDEAALCEAIRNALQAIPPGADGASSFHNLMVGAIEFIFYPNLIYPFKEREIHEGRKRIDITYTNAAREGFFYRLHTAQQIASNMVMVECKNYASDIANPELDQLSSRFSVNRGKFGILIARSCSDRDSFILRCKDTAQDGRGFVVPLFDDDICRMLDAIKELRRDKIDSHLESILAKLMT